MVVCSEAGSALSHSLLRLIMLNKWELKINWFLDLDVATSNLTWSPIRPAAMNCSARHLTKGDYLMTTQKANRKGMDRRTNERRVRNEPVQVERRVIEDQRKNPDRRSKSTWAYQDDIGKYGLWYAPYFWVSPSWIVAQKKWRPQKWVIQRYLHFIIPYWPLIHIWTRLCV